MQKINYIELAKQNLNIEMVISLCGNSIRNGYVDTCIFTHHKNKSANKMKISKDGTYCKCFNCNKSADVVGYWAQYNMISQYNAGKDLCSRFNLVPNCSSNTNLNIKPIKKQIREPETVQSILKNYAKYIEESNIASIDIRDFVYSVFKEACIKYNKYILNKEHQDSLLKERELDEEDIKEDDLFSFPKIKDVYEKYDTDKIKAVKYKYNSGVSSSIIKIMEEIFIKYGKTIDLVRNVPGFQYDTKFNKYTVNLKYNCFAIPVKENGKIVAIHLRRDNLPEDKLDEDFIKYYWFTSKKNYNNDNNKNDNNNKERYIGSASPGTPAITIFPKKLNSKKVFVTEGYFKAKKIAQRFNCVAISAQGVWSWRMIIVAINNLKSKIDIEEIIIAFDADGKCNDSVRKASNCLANVLEKDNIKVSYAIWNLEFGKGIDDVINNGFKDEIYKYEKNIWESKCKIIERYLKSKLKKKLDENMSDDEKKIWVNEFQKLETHTNEEIQKIIKQALN